MAKCKDCIHENVCLHRVNIQTDTYAYMGVKYDTEKCEHFMPTADVAEIVRCKDCKWWEARTHGSTIGRCENPLNGLYNEYSDFADFCSYGERKE